MRTKIVHNVDDLTEDCEELISTNYNRHITMRNMQEMAPTVIKSDGNRLCKECCTTMVIENYE